MENHELDENYPCPCCGYLTLSEQPSGSYEICPVCRWEDDPVQFSQPDFTGGANEENLIQAKENFKLFKASSKAKKKNARDPLAEEIPKKVK